MVVVVLEVDEGPISMRTEDDVVDVDDVDVLEDVVDDALSEGADVSVVDVVSFVTSVDGDAGGELLFLSLADAAQMSPTRNARTPATAAAIAVARPVMT